MDRREHCRCRSSSTLWKEQVLALTAVKFPLLILDECGSLRIPLYALYMLVPLLIQRRAHVSSLFAATAAAIYIERKSIGSPTPSVRRI
uniref:Uncharacterized protein n=1 Tax=Trichogramma kaykai TaxID=54128 RepID=A0ABD2WHZ9_9HYME